jgi:hypothetical protein
MSALKFWADGPPRRGNRYSELFVFYRDGHPVHIHSDRSVFEDWLARQAWQYPKDRCDIERFIPAALTAGQGIEK